MEDIDLRQVPGDWSQVLTNLWGPEWGNDATIAVKIQKEYLMHYSNNAIGAVPWQNIDEFYFGLLFITVFNFRCYLVLSAIK